MTEDEETANLNVGTKKERVRIIGLSSNPVGLTGWKLIHLLRKR